jgi:hypothetical protein
MLTWVGSDSMDREINADSIRDLEEKIEDGAGDIIQLKRTRNSLLNISTRVPPEILGSVFCWNVIPDGSLVYCRMRRGSYNFLLVCHHWFEIASHTPELWSFWGNTLEQWSRRYKCSETAPVDLVLTGSSNLSFDLREALQGRAARDTIRSIWFRHDKTTPLTSVLSSLTPDGEDVRCSSIESISIWHADVSNFFARYRFPKLRYLYLSDGTEISSWELLGLHTTALTTLYLTIGNTSPTPTMSQLLSILALNPRLRKLDLTSFMIPRDNDDGSASRVPLHHLRDLSLNGNFHHTFRLLHRLDHPETMGGTLRLTLSRCTVGDILEILGPYVQDYLRRDERSRDQLGIFVSSSSDSISIQASAIGALKGLTQRDTFAAFTAIFRETLPPPADKPCVDFVAYTPGEHVVYFGGDLSMDAVREIVPAMPNIQELHLTDALLSDGFLLPDPDGPLANTKLLPSLRHLHLEDTVLEDGDWTPLLFYLAHQTSGDQAISFILSGDPIHICKGVVRDVEGLVENFILDFIPDEDCPFGVCPGVDEEGEE